MELKNFWAQDSAGNAVTSPTVTVYQPGTTTLVTGLVNANGTAISNPFTGATSGQITFAAPDGDYDLNVSSGAGGLSTMRVRFISASTGGSGSGVVEVASYAALRVYSGTATSLRVTAPGLNGFFYHDASDTTSADNGGTVIVDVSGRRWKREHSGEVKAAWFGAVGGGTDSTAAITAAFAASDAVLLEDFYSVSAGFSIPAGRSFMLRGIGQSKSGLLYTGAAGAVLFTFSKSHLDKHTLTVTDVGFRSQVAGNTAIKLQASLTGASVQVNGQMDTAFLTNVNISSESATYWAKGIHTVNTGGVHLDNVKVENRDSAQSVAGVYGIHIENNDTRVNVIRAITTKDTYIVRANIGVYCQTLGVSNTIESVYMFGGEIIANRALVTSGNLGAIVTFGVHADVINEAIDCSLAYTTVARFIGCDFRKANNGGSFTPGPLMRFDYGEGVTVSGCFLSGVNENSPSASNVAIKFSNALNGNGLMRSSFSGNVFRSHYYVFSTTPNVNGVTASGNSYGAIAGAVNENTDEDLSIEKLDSVVAHTFIASLNTSGDQAIAHTPPNALKFFSGAHLIVVPTLASTYSQNLTVSFDYDASSNSNYVFRVKGNTAGVQNVRISYIAQGQSVNQTN